MKKLLLVLALLLLPSIALAQCNGVFPNNTACGNISGGNNTPRAIPLSSFPASAPGGLTGNVQTNGGSGTFAGITNIQLTALLNAFTSTLSGVVPASGGGTANFLRADGTFAPPTGGSVVYTPPGTGAIATTVQAELQRKVWIKDYGAKCDGSTDDTTAIQNAWNYAQTASLDVWLGGIGQVCIFSQLTAPTPTGIGISAKLHGPGSGQVVLLSNVTGSNCAITISATYGVNSYLRGEYSGFTLGTVTNHVGTLLCLNNITKATFRDVDFENANIAFNGNDDILINILECFFRSNLIGITGQQVSNSGPNMWNIGNSHFANNGAIGISLTAPNLVNIYGNDFESNGLTNGTSGLTIFVPSISPSFPVVGINVYNNYFEGNEGVEIQITPQTGSSSVHNVNNNIFNRTLVAETAGILISNAAGAQTNVNVGGNSFLDVTGVPGSFQWLQVTNSGTLNYTFDCAVRNSTNTPAEINARCGGARIGATTISSDTNGTFIGLN